ncbi:AAA family ATPase [Solidesulfovibrio carbinolicus]|uniref:Uncharacterized protein n=1 Tax=Solidesulfovibrio carbinolicus TaxID=296842 RepID=A0A4P6I127_9BACT|nr:AAA family ATPase [Solidesulfovibrio carbinolicus]QAZ67459.1 hypothetical protein C3Y92_09580 [Solidesulfovibrio carbinolicus]
MGLQIFDVITDYFVPDFELDANFWNQFVPIYNSEVPEVAEASPRCDDAPFFIVSPGKPCRSFIPTETPKEPEKSPKSQPEVDYIKKITFPTIQQFEYPKIPLSEVRKTMSDAVSGSRNVVIATTPGSGKTTTIKKRIEELCKQERTVLYAAPTNKVVDETDAALKQVLYAQEIHNTIRYEARNEDNCKHFNACRVAMALNQSVYKTVCIKRCDEKKTGEDRCWYLAQLDSYENGVISGTHDASPFVISKVLDNSTRFDEILIDETPRPAFVSSDSITLNNFRLLQEGMQETEWFKKLSNFINNNMLKIGEKHYIQMPLCVSNEHVAQMNESGAWEALKKVFFDADSIKHRRACVEREKQNQEYNKGLPKINKARLKQYKLEKEAFLIDQKKTGILIAQEKYPEFVPTPERNEMPAFIHSDLPNKQSWEEKWRENQWITREECPVHNLGINGKDIAEAIIKFYELAKIYEDSEAAINGLEFEFFRAALGLSEDDAYIEAKEITIKSKDPDEDDKTQKSIAFRIVKRKKMEFGQSRLVVLDGTADEEELRALFDCEFDFVKADSMLQKTYTVFFEQSLGSRDARYLAKSALSKKRPDDKRIRRLLSRSIAKLKKTNKKVLLLTFKDLSDVLLKIAKEIDPSREYVNTHYYGNRGLNEFEDCDAVIAIGTPFVSPIDFEPISIKLFGYVNEQWIARQGLRELIQSIHRIRPINHETTIILTGNYFPTEAFGRPDLHIQAQRDGERDKLVQKAVELLIPIAKELKCLTQEIAGEYGLFDEEDFKSIEKHEQDGKEVVLRWTHKEWPTIIKKVAKICGLPVVARQQKRGAPRLAAGADRAFVALGRKRRAGGLQ